MCQQDMVLLLQAYCPLEGSIYHRLLHIFCCPQPVCYNNDGLVHLFNIMYICHQLASAALSTKRAAISKNLIGTRFQNK